MLMPADRARLLAPAAYVYVHVYLLAHLHTVYPTWLPPMTHRQSDAGRARYGRCELHWDGEMRGQCPLHIRSYGAQDGQGGASDGGDKTCPLSPGIGVPRKGKQKKKTGFECEELSSLGKGAIHDEDRPGQATYLDCQASSKKTSASNQMDTRADLYVTIWRTCCMSAHLQPGRHDWTSTEFLLDHSFVVAMTGYATRCPWSPAVAVKLVKFSTSNSGKGPRCGCGSGRFMGRPAIRGAAQHSQHCKYTVRKMTTKQTH